MWGQNRGNACFFIGTINVLRRARVGFGEVLMVARHISEQFRE
jgi:hypothetical protein